MWNPPRTNPVASSTFFIYANDLHKIEKNAFLLLFVNDSNLFYTGNDMVAITKMNDDLQH